MKIGFGYDVHTLTAERRLILGGVDIPSQFGLSGHSDADVLIHAIIDAVLGALALGDIGKLFPDNDAKYRNIDSRVLLREICTLMKEQGYEIGNLDSTVCLQEPKLRGFIDLMRVNIAADLETAISNVSVKATTEEGLGVSGKKEGASCYAVVLLQPKQRA